MMPSIFEWFFRLRFFSPVSSHNGLPPNHDFPRLTSGNFIVVLIHNSHGQAGCGYPIMVLAEDQPELFLAVNNCSAVSAELSRTELRFIQLFELGKSIREWASGCDRGVYLRYKLEELDYSGLPVCDEEICFKSGHWVCGSPTNDLATPFV